jgi:hypothetical protein
MKEINDKIIKKARRKNVINKAYVLVDILL